MRVQILAADSMGVRSMATLIECKKEKLVIDPGVALAPNRYGYGPHPIEIELIEKLWAKIRRAVEKASTVIISHYHYDHYNPEEVDIFEGKTLYIKDPKNNINKSQKARAQFFLEELSSVKDVEVNIAEEQRFSIGEMRVETSKAVPHGPSTRLGYVVETFIRCAEESFLHSSDVEGPALDEQVAFILKHKPKTAMVDGPLSYIMQRYGHNNLVKAISNLNKIVEHSNLIYEHHFLRDLHYKEKIKPVEERAKSLGRKAQTAAEFMGKKTNVLENKRKELYEKYPVD